MKNMQKRKTLVFSRLSSFMVWRQAFLLLCEDAPPRGKSWNYYFYNAFVLIPKKNAEKQTHGELSFFVVSWYEMDDSRTWAPMRYGVEKAENTTFTMCSSWFQEKTTRSQTIANFAFSNFHVVKIRVLSVQQVHGTKTQKLKNLISWEEIKGFRRNTRKCWLYIGRPYISALSGEHMRPWLTKWRLQKVVSS